MHIKASTAAADLREPGRQFRFFRDKVLLFHEFDPESIVLKRNSSGEICGILIFTYCERAFNEFAGPGHIRFYTRAIKALLGFYGFNFKKFFTAARSMTGSIEKSLSAPAGDFGKIWVLLVMEECRNQGIATELIKGGIELMRQKKGRTLIVTVKTDNVPAIRTYEKCGFKNIGTCEESSGHSYILQLDLP
ncbi:MAG: hypothetical protein A2X48_14365 [Lentisphaerae bacterium GWF2_49_21]|nr:MAG: hypothetical protein A2X48_14365 [Lentisphaerae bacterium GWF2_49_21]